MKALTLTIGEKKLPSLNCKLCTSLSATALQQQGRWDASVRSNRRSHPLRTEEGKCPMRAGLSTAALIPKMSTRKCYMTSARSHKTSAENFEYFE